MPQLLLRFAFMLLLRLFFPVSKFHIAAPHWARRLAIGVLSTAHARVAPGVPRLAQGLPLWSHPSKGLWPIDDALRTRPRLDSF